MTGGGRMLRWVAKRGEGYWDWAIYCHWAKTGLTKFILYEVDTDWDYVKVHGQKVTDDNNIRRCINASDEAMKLYRK